MSITYAKNSGLVKTPPTVEIGNNIYTYIQIGSLYWITEDLKEVAGTINTDYKIIDGKYYYKYGFTAVNNLISGTGFRVCTNADLQNLFSNRTGAQLCSTTGWDNLGNNQSGMNFKQKGYIRDGQYLATETDKWLFGVDPVSNKFAGIRINNGSLQTGNNFEYVTGTNDFYNVRLCRNA